MVFRNWAIPETFTIYFVKAKDRMPMVVSIFLVKEKFHRCNSFIDPGYFVTRQYPCSRNIRCPIVSYPKKQSCWARDDPEWRATEILRATIAKVTEPSDRFPCILPQLINVTMSWSRTKSLQAMTIKLFSATPSVNRFRSSSELVKFLKPF